MGPWLLYALSHDAYLFLVPVPILLFQFVGIIAFSFSKCPDLELLKVTVIHFSEIQSVAVYSSSEWTIGWIPTLIAYSTYSTPFSITNCYILFLLPIIWCMDLIIYIMSFFGGRAAVQRGQQVKHILFLHLSLFFAITTLYLLIATNFTFFLVTGASLCLTLVSIRCLILSICLCMNQA